VEKITNIFGLLSEAGFLGSKERQDSCCCGVLLRKRDASACEDEAGRFDQYGASISTGEIEEKMYFYFAEMYYLQYKRKYLSW